MILSKATDLIDKKLKEFKPLTPPIIPPPDDGNPFDFVIKPKPVRGRQLASL
jgi:hypothetical protein